MRTRDWRRAQAGKRKARLRRELVETLRWEEQQAATSRRGKRLRAAEEWRRYYFRNEGRGFKPYRLLCRCTCSYCVGGYRSQLDRLNQAADAEWKDWRSAPSRDWANWPAEWLYDLGLDYDPWEESPPAWHWFEWEQVLMD